MRRGDRVQYKIEQRENELCASDVILLKSNLLRWNENIETTLRNYIRDALDRINVNRYSQEPAYISAVLAKLDGLVYDEFDGRIEFVNTVVNALGRNCAESIVGADFAIIAKLLHRDYGDIEKALLGQGKRGNIFNLDANERRRLLDQCHRMKRYTPHYIIFETPETQGEKPRIRFHYENSSQFRFSDTISIEDYIINSLITCFHGDNEIAFVNRVKRSDLNQLLIRVSNR